MMTPQRLWPVMSALLLMLGGAVGLEAAAVQRGTKTEIIEIRDTAVADDGEDDVSDEEWIRVEPVNEDHARCRTLARRGDFAAAAELMAKVVESKPNDGLLLAEQGHLLRKARRYDEALAVLARARQADSVSPSIDLDEGLIFRRLGRPDDAIKSFARAAERRPNHTSTLLAYAAQLRDGHKYDEALKLLKEASERGSNDERARSLAALGRTLVEAGKYDEAPRAFERAVERAPAMTSIWLTAARTLSKSDRPEDAELGLKYAINAAKLAPGLASAHGALARAFETMGREEDAIEAYERAVTVEQGYTWGLERLLRIHLEREDFRQARSYAEQLEKTDSGKREYVFLSGSVESAAGRYETAREKFQAAIDASEDPYPEAWYNLGIVERRLNNLDASIAAYEKSIELRPDYRAAWNNLGLSLDDAGRLDESERALRHAIELKPDYVPAWSNLARIYADHDRHAEAVTAYSRLVELRPKDQGDRMKLAIELRRAGKPEEAIATYKTLVEAEPRYVAAWYNLGIAYNALDRSEEARRAYESALKLDPSHRKALKNLGLLLARMGEHQAAETRLLEYLDFEPGNDGVRLRLAESEKSRGDLQACSAETSRILAHDPANERAGALHKECQTTVVGEGP